MSSRRPRMTRFLERFRPALRSAFVYLYQFKADFRDWGRIGADLESSIWIFCGWVADDLHVGRGRRSRLVLLETGRNGRGTMKYLGVAFACCTAVIIAAAIYLMGTPNAAPPAALEVDISSTLPNISTPSEIPAALSQYELTSLSAEQFAGDGPKPDQARLEAESPARELASEATVGANLPGSELQGADLQASPDPAADHGLAADPGPPSQNEALLPHQSSAADDTANPVQARWEENSPESAEPAAEYSTASATETSITSALQTPPPTPMSPPHYRTPSPQSFPDSGFTA